MNLDNIVLPKTVAVKFIQKKFYNKYIFKLEFNVPTPKVSAGTIGANRYGYYSRGSTSSIRVLTQQLANTIGRIVQDKDYRCRVEYNTLTYFTNCEQDVIDLIDKNSDKLVAIYRPVSEEHIATIEMDTRIRVRNRLFDDRFKFKIYFKNVYKLRETKFSDIRAWTEVTDNEDGKRWGLNSNLNRFLNLGPNESSRGIGWTIAVFLNEPEDLMLFQLKFHNDIHYIEEAVLLSEL